MGNASQPADAQRVKLELLSLVVFIVAVAYIRGQYGWVATEVARTDRPPIVAPAPPIGEQICGPYNQRCNFNTRPIELDLDSRVR